MTEPDEWDVCTDLRRLSELLDAADRARPRPRTEFAERTATVLFIAGVCRDLWPLISDPRHRRSVEAVELYWTGQLGDDEYSAAVNASTWPAQMHDEHPPRTPTECAEWVARLLDAHDDADFANCLMLARDQAAEAVRRSPRVPKAAGYLRPLDGADEVLCDRLRCLLANPFHPSPFDPVWRSPTVTAIAAGVLADRDWSRLPVLADALEDAGCNNAELLAHARGPGPHLFGCRVVSACLGHPGGES